MTRLLRHLWLRLRARLLVARLNSLIEDEWVLLQRQDQNHPYNSIPHTRWRERRRLLWAEINTTRAKLLSTRTQLRNPQRYHQ